MIEKNRYFFLFLFLLNRIASSLTSAFGIGIMDKEGFFFFCVDFERKNSSDFKELCR